MVRRLLTESLLLAFAGGLEDNCVRVPEKTEPAPSLKCAYASRTIEWKGPTGDLGGGLVH
jgi:hypothetical protein